MDFEWFARCGDVQCECKSQAIHPAIHSRIHSKIHPFSKPKRREHSQFDYFLITFFGLSQSVSTFSRRWTFRIHSTDRSSKSMPVYPLDTIPVCISSLSEENGRIFCAPLIRPSQKRSPSAHHPLGRCALLAIAMHLPLTRLYLRKSKSS